MKKFRDQFLLPLVLVLALIINIALFASSIILAAWPLLVISLLFPLLIVLVGDYFQTRHTILRNYPLVGRFRYIIESLRPKFVQYLETDLDGRPFNRRQRSLVYQRAKNVRDTVAFGMQADPYSPGYEWLSHSIYPVKVGNRDLRSKIGLQGCQHPYDLSVLNIGAMSYGALSKTAVISLSEGARMGGFAMNTGEGGISPYHLDGGADLIWQIGTGYFGCRRDDGRFSARLFRKNALAPNVKMIELKLSQGAKPGHGGILPAVKNTPEIAAIRNVTPGVTIYSPGHHSAFSNASELLSFVDYLKLLSGHKPVGIKLCIGSRREFEELCQMMCRMNTYPDFITVDGAEGGTGAAPLEFTDHLGMPLLDALAFVSSMKRKYKIRSSVIASGKIISAFDILRAIAMGADACYSARGMMMALGCIQALTCDSGKCPVGITTQNKRLYRGIDIEDKRVRVANFHENTINAMVELMEASGYQSLYEIRPSDFNRRLDRHQSKTLEQIYFRGENFPNQDSSPLYTYLN